jgi:hypothetical protein
MYKLTEKGEDYLDSTNGLPKSLKRSFLVSLSSGSSTVDFAIHNMSLSKNPDEFLEKFIVGLKTWESQGLIEVD